MNMKIRHSFALKLSLYTIICVIVVFVGVLVYNYQISKRLIIESTYKDVEDIANMTLNRINSLLTAAQKVPEDLASFVEYSNQTKNELLNMLRSVVETNPEIYGSTISFEPYMFKKNIEYFGPYFYKSPEGIKYINLASPKYDYIKRTWYTLPKELGHRMWSEPFFDEGGVEILMVTYSQPFYKNIDGKRIFAGIATCDIALDWLVDMTKKIKVFDTGYAYILSNKGIFIAHPNKEYYTKCLNYYDLVAKNNDISAKKICDAMTNGETGFLRYYSYNRKEYCYVYFQPLKETGWSLAIVIPENELYSSLQKTTLELMIIGLIGYILTLVFIVILANFATNPLKSLAKATLKIGKGDFHTVIPEVKSRDEIGILSNSFVTMQNNLIKYVNDLKETTSAKERIEKELSIARDIQQSILPRNFPENKEFDIYANLIPAKEVGGDLYDFFFIDDDNLCFAVGDVSGKGVPAALFMAITKTLFRSKVNASTTLDEAVTQINKAFFKEGDTSMFTTFFACILNIKTGCLKCCNAGHNPPILCSKDTTCHYLESKEIFLPVGVMEDTEYKGYELTLEKGDKFILYTDGITEAMSKDSVQFSDEKLIELIEASNDKPLDELSKSVIENISQHAEGAEQSDDITLFVLRYNGV